MFWGKTLEKIYHEYLYNGERELAAYTLIKYHYDFYPFIQKYSGLKAHKVTPEIVLEWFRELEGRGIAEATLAKHRGVFRAFFNYCVKKGYCKKSPAEVLPTYSDKPAVVHLPPKADVETCIKTAWEMSEGDDVYSRRAAAVFMLCYTFGNRRGELRNANLSAFWKALERPVEYEEETFYIMPTTGKTGAAKIVFSHAQKGFILRYLQLAPEPKDDALWMNLDPNHIAYGTRLSDMGMGRTRRLVLKMAGVGRLTYQDLRRWRGSMVARSAGVDQAALVLGHKSGTAVFRDFYYDPDAVRAYMEALRTAE